MRCALGIFDGEPVLVEWKHVEEKDKIRQQTLKGRISNLVKLLMMDKQPQKIRILQCFGVICQSSTLDTEIYFGFLFEVSGSISATLNSRLQNETPTQLLDEQRSIARAIAKAVLFLHFVGRLYKGIRSDNLIFFGSGLSSLEVTNSYILGFEYSRQSGEKERTEKVDGDLEANSYCYPYVQGLPEDCSHEDGEKELRNSRPFFKYFHGVYSLGVVLLELGLMRQSHRHIRSHLQRCRLWRALRDKFHFLAD